MQRDPPATASSTTAVEVRSEGPPSSTVDPCNLLTVAELGVDGLAYGPGVRSTAAAGSACVFPGLDDAGTVTVTVHTQADIDRDRGRDPNLAYATVRQLLEHTRSLAAGDNSTYVKPVGGGVDGYEITSTRAGDTDRLAAMSGENLVVLAVTDPPEGLDTVRHWLELVLTRL